MSKNNNESVEKGNLVNAAKNQNVVAVKESFKRMISPRIVSAISARKAEIAKDIFNTK